MNNGDKRITRKDFFSLVGWGGMLSTLAGSVLGFYRFYFPNVLYESQKVFKIGKPSDFPEGLSEKWKKERQVWVARNKSGIYVMISICRHLGCTPNWFSDQQKFRCPCHGSIYDIMGNVLGGPAPRLLWRAAIKIDPVDGQIIVDFNHRQDPDPVSTENGLMVEEASREVEPFFLKV